MSAEVKIKDCRTHYVTTAGGRKFVIGVARQRVELADIAAQLAKINRWAGATDFAFSVAQHAVLVSNIVLSLPGATALIALQALHHDDREIVCGDMTAPFIHAVRERIAAVFAGADPAEELLLIADDAIYSSLGIPLPSPQGAAMIKRADHIARATERRDLMSNAEVDPNLPQAWRRPIKPLRHWTNAEQAFLDRHNELVALCGALLADAA